MNNLPAAETSSNRPIRSTNVKNNFMSKFKDFVIPSSFKFPESKRQALQNSINLKSKSSPFKKSNSNLRSSHRSVHSTCENKTEGIIEMVNFKMNQSPRQSERDRNVGGYGYGSSPDLNSSRDNLFQASSTRDLNNGNDYTNKSRKSPDLDFHNDTVSTHLKKSAINLINEVTELLSTQSVKSCTINLSPDMSYDTGKHKDYNKDDMFVNSVPAHSQSQSSQNSEPKSGKLIVTDTDGSPDLYVTKHIKPNSADLFLSQASNVNDSPDLFPLSMISPEFPTCKSPDLFQRSQNSQNSCIESSQCSGEMIHASCSPFSSLISSINKGNIPSTQKPGLLPDPNLDESLDCSIIQCSQEDDGKKSHETPNAAPDKGLDCKLAQVFNQKRLLQDSFCPPNKKPKLKPTLVSPVEGVDVCEVFDAVKYLETRVIEQPHPHNTSFDPLLASVNTSDFQLHLGEEVVTSSKQALSSSKQGTTITKTKDGRSVKQGTLVDKRSMLNTLNKAMLDIAVDEYYAQTVSSQYMSSLNKLNDSDLFQVPALWKEDSSVVASHSILNPKDDTIKVTPSKQHIPKDCPGLLRDCTDIQPHCSDKVEDCLDFDVKDVTGEVDVSPKDDETLFSNEEFAFLNDALVISDESKSCGLLDVTDILKTKLSDSSDEKEDIVESTTRMVKSLREKIEQIKKANEMKMGKKTNQKIAMSTLTGLGNGQPVGQKLSSQFAKDVDVYSSDIHYIESSPSHKVEAWLEKHLNGEKSVASPEINELKIEDFNSEEMPEDERDTVMSSKIEEAPEGDKENMDLLNTVQTQGTLEPVEKQLVIEDFNTEKVQDRNTQKIVEDVNIEKYKNGTPLKVVEKINTETTEHVRTQRMIEETNTEKFTNTQRMIEEINTEKCEDLMCSQDEQSFQIECPGSPDAADDNGETVRAAQILMSFNNWTLPSRDHDITVVPEKTIKFKPGSLGARLRLELNKQKSATEIWKYEVTKASESQDQETLAQLFRGQLDLTIVNFWSECSNVVVKAVKTQPSPGSTDTDNTVLLLLHASNFPARFKTQRGQNFSIFPPWISHYVPELDMSFLTNIERIRFSESTRAIIEERTSLQPLQIDQFDEDFYMKLIGIGGTLASKKD